MLKKNEFENISELKQKEGQKNKENIDIEEKEKKKNNKEKQDKNSENLIANINKNKEHKKKEKNFNFFEINNEKINLLLPPLSLKDPSSIQKSILSHISHTICSLNFQIQKESLYLGTSLSVKNILLSRMNATEEYILKNNPKKIHYMSIEFLLGKLL